MRISFYLCMQLHAFIVVCTTHNTCLKQFQVNQDSVLNCTNKAVSSDLNLNKKRKFQQCATDSFCL